MEGFKFQRNISVFLLLLMSVTLIILSVSILNQKKEIILVPTLTQTMTIGSDEYFKLRAKEILSLVTHLTRENFKTQKEQLLSQVSTGARASFEKQLDIYWNDLNKSDYYYLFFPKSFEVIGKGRVRSSGDLKHIVADRQVHSQHKEFTIGFETSGMFNLIFFEGGKT